MKEEQVRNMLGRLAEELVPDDIDLWPAIQSHFEMSKNHSSIKGDFSMKTNLAQKPIFRLATISLLILLALGFFLFATPQGRAVAQNLLHLFTHASSDVLPAPTDVPITWVNQTPEDIQPSSTPIPGFEFALTCGRFPDLKCSVDQIRSMVDFSVKELGTIPDGVHFLGVTGGPDRIYLIYDTPGHQGAITVWQSLWTGSPDQNPWKVGASANIEEVTINGKPGEYVKGSFIYHDGQTTMNWDASLDVQTLVWVDNGVLIELQSTGTALPIDKDKLVQLAETLTTDPVTIKPTSLPVFTATPTLDAIKQMNDIWDFISIDELEQLAGYKLLQPATLPDFLSFLGATYDSELRVVRLHYLYDQSKFGPNTDGLILAEEKISSDGNCSLCGFLAQDMLSLEEENKDGKIVHDFITITIGNSSGQYVAGNWESADPTSGYWKWNKDPYSKRLRWQVNSMAFELSYWGNALSQADMIDIAENMR